MAKWGVQDVLKELEDIDKMARLRTASTVVQQLVSSLKQKIQGMGRLTASTLVSITSALDNSPQCHSEGSDFRAFGAASSWARALCFEVADSTTSIEHSLELCQCK